MWIVKYLLKYRDSRDLSYIMHYVSWKIFGCYAFSIIQFDCTSAIFIFISSFITYSAYDMRLILRGLFLRVNSFLWWLLSLRLNELFQDWYNEEIFFSLIGWIIVFARFRYWIVNLFALFNILLEGIQCAIVKICK